MILKNKNERIKIKGKQRNENKRENHDTREYNRLQYLKQVIFKWFSLFFSIFSMNFDHLGTQISVSFRFWQPVQSAIFLWPFSQLNGQLPWHFHRTLTTSSFRPPFSSFFHSRFRCLFPFYFNYLYPLSCFDRTFSSILFIVSLWNVCAPLRHFRFCLLKVIFFLYHIFFLLLPFSSILCIRIPFFKKHLSLFHHFSFK